MDTVIAFLVEAGANLLHVLKADYLFLLAGVILAVALKVYVDFGALKERLTRKTSASVFSSVAFGTFTPFCACGTMAIVLPMIFAALPWSVVMSFLTSSAMMCPTTFIFYAGAVGFGFATAVTAASVFVGLSAGFVSAIIEKRTTFFNNGHRNRWQGCGCSIVSAVKTAERGIIQRLKVKEFFSEFYKIGFKFVLPYFCLFALLAFLVDKFVPSAWISSAFGSKNIFSVPIAALAGLPMYVGSAGALPLIQTLLKAGASHGSLLAFLVTGPGTSIAVISGLSLILKWRVVALYIGFIFLGGVISGYAYDIILML